MDIRHRAAMMAGNWSNRLENASTLARLTTAATCVALTGVLFIVSDTPVEGVAEDVAGEVCDQLDRKCFYVPEVPPLAEGLEGGIFDMDTTVLRGIKSIDARFEVDSNIPLTDITVDSASSSARGTAGFEGVVDGLVAVSPRSTGTAVALTLPGGHFIDVSSFYFRSLEPRNAIDGVCPELMPWEVNTGCMDRELHSAKFDNVPFINADPGHTAATEVGKIADIYQIEQRCLYDHILQPIMIETAENYKLELVFPVGPERFTSVAQILIAGALRTRFSQLGPAQKILVPMTGTVAPPPDIATLFKPLETETGNSIQAPRNIQNNYCADTGVIGLSALDALRGQVARLTMAGLAPEYFNIQTMAYEFGNEALTEPTAAEKEALGVPIS